MKKAIIIGFLCSFSCVALSQTGPADKYIDSLRTELSQATNDTVKMIALFNLGDYYIEANRDSALISYEQALPIAKKLDQPLWIAVLLMNKGYVLMHQGNLPVAFKLINEAMTIVKDEKSEKNAYILKTEEFASNPHQYRLILLAGAMHHLGNLYSNTGDKEKAIAYYKAEIQLSGLLESKSGLVTSNMNIGSIYLDLGNLDSAFFYSARALDNSMITGWLAYQGSILEDIGSVYFKRKQLDSARHYYWRSLSVSKEQNNVSDEVSIYITLSKFYESVQQADSMLYYAKAALHMATNLKAANGIAASAALVSGAYQLQANTDSAFAYMVISKRVGDSLQADRNQKLTQFQNVNFDEQRRLEQAEQENVAYKNRMRTAALFAGLGLLSILAFVFYRNTRQKQKANKILESALNSLKSTQSQLIQSEKMASLGELTAGIAHEIQNPLNFVNNFSEVNKELLTEMKEEINKGNLEEVKVIAGDVIDNEEKIIFHGKRADAIVKGMLQHSRSSSGQKEPTDINALTDEYFRLAYHGLRAKDKSFNATMKMDFDKNTGNISIIPQDIGRVILNLITNAFYTVSEKKRQSGEEYEPTVTVSTKKIDGMVKIVVQDNGNGIPDKALDKIFQPFFTTKPTGQGTGLGLSLSYDIVKAHGGELKVTTKEGEGTEFIIQLPWHK